MPFSCNWHFDRNFSLGLNPRTKGSKLFITYIKVTTATATKTKTKEMKMSRKKFWKVTTLVARIVCCFGNMDHKKRILMKRKKTRKFNAVDVVRKGWILWPSNLLKDMFVPYMQICYVSLSVTSQFVTSVVCPVTIVWCRCYKSCSSELSAPRHMASK